MAQNPKRPVQASDNLGRTLTSFAEGVIRRIPLPANGRWFRVAEGVHAVRLRIAPGRRGVIYTTSKASEVPVQHDEAVSTDSIAASDQLEAGGRFLLTFAGPADVFLAVDPDADTNLGPPLVTVVESAGA